MTVVNRRSLLSCVVMLFTTLACMEQIVTTTPTAEPSPSATAAPSQTPEPTATRIPTQTQDVQTTTVRAAIVNIRATPGGDVIGYVEAGQVVSVLGCDVDWCEIEQGWIWAGCLEGINEKGCQAQ